MGAHKVYTDSVGIHLVLVLGFFLCRIKSFVATICLPETALLILCILLDQSQLLSFFFCSSFKLLLQQSNSFSGRVSSGWTPAFVFLQSLENCYCSVPDVKITKWKQTGGQNRVLIWLCVFGCKRLLMQQRYGPYCTTIPLAQTWANYTL